MTAELYASVGAPYCAASGCSKQPPNRIKIRTSRQGQSSLPSQRVSLSGCSATRKAALKNSTEYPSCSPALLPSSGVSMAKEVLAVRGMARHGPMDR